jgi:cytochrome bd ubiquinol oxidase subunit II
MEALWFCLVAIMVAGYVVLDGFDLGAGAIHLCVAHTDDERRRVFKSIGPVWNGNEVWLLAGGGTLYFAFPELYASGFSGFYLPLMIVLWLLILRGASIEFRSHLESPVWRPFWDVVFCGASGLLAIFFGAALGNVVRGVPVGVSQPFFLPLWASGSPFGEPGILDWYTVLAGVAAFAVLVNHGALWLIYKNEGPVRDRARRVFRFSWPAVLAMTILITIVSFAVQPHLAHAFAERPWGYVFPLLALAGLLGMKIFARGTGELLPFLLSALYIVGMLTSAVFGVFPYVLPPNSSAFSGLTIHNAATSEYGMQVALYWFVPGMFIAGAYFWYIYRTFAGKVVVDEAGY